jgi:hypothetical protein
MSYEQAQQKTFKNLAQGEEETRKESADAEEFHVEVIQ